jgi:RimJ/RimL family protein N-acetyltransferase
MGELLEIGYAIAPSERGKGYCTEATQLMVDYLFLSKDVSRIQAATSYRKQRFTKGVGKSRLHA